MSVAGITMRAELRKPFPKAQIGKLPATARRPELDYVGHAAVTDRLNHVAPDWFYTVDEMFSMDGVCWIRGTMTVGGVSRPEYGDGKDPKEAIGNFIRRGAMRFGVAIDLWSREELDTSGASPSSASLPSQRSSQQAAAPEETSTKAPLLFCRQSGCGHESALHPLGLACEGINGSHNDPEGGEYPCRCKGFVPPSGPVQGEGAANPPGGTTGEGGQAPSPTTDDSLPATAEDWAVAKRNGLTATKAKAIAKGLGFTPDNVLDLTRREVAAVINRYLEVKK